MSFLKIATLATALTLTAVPAMAQSTKKDMRICGGAPGGAYLSYVSGLRDILSGTDVNIIPVRSAGTADNIRKLQAKECDAALLQQDVATSFFADNPDIKIEYSIVRRAFKESIHIVCPKSDPVTGVSGLSSDYIMLIGAKGSSGEYVWKRIVSSDQKKFSEIGVRYVGGEDALTTVAEEGRVLDAERKPKTACMLWTGQIGASIMSKGAEDRNDRVKLISVDHAPIYALTSETGTLLYEKASFGSTYPHISRREVVVPGGWLSSDKKEIIIADTAQVNAILVVSNAWKDANPDGFSDFTTIMRQKELPANNAPKKN